MAQANVVYLKPQAPETPSASPAEHAPGACAPTNDEFIERAFERLASDPGFVVRPQQKDLAYAIYKSLLEDAPLVAEAPTGTGKTLAYLIGGIAASRRAEIEGRPMPLVVSTATVALQDQVLRNEIPKLMSLGLLAQGEAQVAKGRGRYLCVRSAEMLADADATNQLDLLDAQANQQAREIAELQVMLEKFHGAAWSGDIDAYDDLPPDRWRDVAANSETCIGHRCEWFEKCPYFAERKKLAYARVIVANHALVLADLKLAVADQETVLPGARYFAVFDEAHHLPAKAADAYESRADFDNVRKQLDELPKWLARPMRVPEIVRLFSDAGVGPEQLDPTSAIKACSVLCQEVRAVEVDADSDQKVFLEVSPPESLLTAIRSAKVRLEELAFFMEKIHKALKETRLHERRPQLKGMLANLLSEAAQWNAFFEAVAQPLESFASADDNIVRWVSHKDGEPGVRLQVALVEGGPVLSKLVWENPRVSSALVSATLKDFGEFKRFKLTADLPAHTRVMALPPVFPYRECEIVLARMKASPRSRPAFLKELSRSLPDYVRQGEGNLVLCTSKEMLSLVGANLRRRFGDAALIQYEIPLATMLSRHKRRIEQGRTSVLAGVASLSEGLDLPGELCEHVLITAIPFASPANPVQAARAKRYGKAYFSEHLLPDALEKLVQMVGRLMRRETDRGRITMFDSRLYSVPYGKKLMQALPGYRVRFEDESDRAARPSHDSCTDPESDSVPEYA